MKTKTLIEFEKERNENMKFDLERTIEKCSIIQSKFHERISIDCGFSFTNVW